VGSAGRVRGHLGRLIAVEVHARLEGSDMGARGAARGGRRTRCFAPGPILIPVGGVTHRPFLGVRVGAGSHGEPRAHPRDRQGESPPGESQRAISRRRISTAWGWLIVPLILASACASTTKEAAPTPAPPSPSPSSVPFIAQIRDLETHRCQGVGQALLPAVEDRARGCDSNAVLSSIALG
jgi:hypothetical protein